MTIEDGRSYRQEAHEIWKESNSIKAENKAINAEHSRLAEEATRGRDEANANLKEVRELEKYWSARGEKLMEKELAHQKSTESFKLIMSESRTLLCDTCYAKLLEPAPQ